jgi:hypothetical protein
MLGTQCWGEEGLYAFGRRRRGRWYVPIVPPPLQFREISQTTEQREWSLSPSLASPPQFHRLCFKGFCWATAGAAAAWETPSNPEFSSPKPGKNEGPTINASVNLNSLSCS